MKIPKIADAINNIDEDLVVAAMEDKKKTKRKGIVKWSIAVAASLLIVAAGFFAAGKMGLFDEISDRPSITVKENGTSYVEKLPGNSDESYYWQICIPSSYKGPHYSQCHSEAYKGSKGFFKITGCFTYSHGKLLLNHSHVYKTRYVVHK